MACKYIYKGHVFNSELALDDFLIEKERYISELGDIVFNSTSYQNPIHARLLEISRTCAKLKEDYNRYRHNKLQLVFDEDGAEVNVPPYIGVNRYISMQRADGSRLVREFKDNVYWENRKLDWKNGIFTDNEREWFGLDPSYNTLWTDLECENHKNELINKWDTLAKTGTAIHEVLQLFFTRTKNANNEEVYVYELPDFKDHILNNLSDENKPYLNPKAIEDAITYATNLRDLLQTKYGKNAIFLPEFAVDGNAPHPQTGNDIKLYGIIDLLVVDETGNVHIIDYKTSIKPYAKFNSDKLMAYRYLMATYQRMLSRHGINTVNSDLYVAPIQITDFRNEGNGYTYTSIDINEPIHLLNTEITLNEWDNIDDFMPPLFNISLTTQDAMLNVSDIMKKWFKGYSGDKLITEQQVRDKLEKLGLLKTPENGVYSYKPGGSSLKPITATDPVEFVRKVLLYEQTLPKKRLQIMGAIKGVMKLAIKQGNPEVDWPLPASTRTGASVTWLKDTMSSYCHDTWEVLDNEVLEAYGIITLVNPSTKQIDFIRISTNTLDYNYHKSLEKENPAKSRLGLTGELEPDVVELANSNSLMVEAANGNIEIMEMMAILNLTEGFGDAVIGNMLVLNPFDAKSVSMSNEEALYCFNRLNLYHPMAMNKFDEGKIKLASKFQLAYNKFKDIMKRGEANLWKDVYAKFKSFLTCTSLMDQAISDPSNIEQLLNALKKLLDQAENDRKLSAIASRTYTDLAELQQDWNALYRLIRTALAQLKGINFRQQLTDHKQWLESALNLSGTYLDNPGNLSSETLNTITKLVTEAYQNTRDDMQRSKNRILEKIQKLKKAKGFGYLKENIGFNQADLYKDMFVEVDGDLMFKNLSELSGPDREFLEFALEEINRNRHPDWTDDIRLQKRDTYDYDYYKVPLARGSSDSTVSSRGLLRLIRDKLSSWTPAKIFQRGREKIEGIYEAANTPNQLADNVEVLYKMTNMFDHGEETPDTRKEAIARVGIFNLERNMETLLLKHDFAYILLKNMDSVFPLIKAATIHLTELGANANTTFKLDLKYVQEYIKNKIFNLSIVNEENLQFTNIANMIKKAASMFTLAFSPVLMLYQPLQGLWQDISLMIRRPDGTEAFTFGHFKNAIKLVYGDLFNFSGKPTLCSLINEIYGINDMDMNTYVDRISHARKGIFYNFDNFAFKFASRPDYYNRLSIFLSQMLGDGCLEAHKVVNGQLLYDWKLDKRFSAFAKGQTSHPEYHKLKSLYYAVALQFTREHAKNPDGSDFVLDMNDPKPLPKAYTNKLAESMKSLGDDIYGYYSHEKKSMVMSTALGSMWLLFKTFWSGKKNQYLQKGGVRLKGKWELYSERDKDGNQVKYYYQTDSNGNIQFDKKPLTEQEAKALNKPLIAPVMQWKGLWLEGILVTMGDILVNAARDPKNTMLYIKQKWNTSDENLRNCYLSNIKQFGYDILMFFIVGSILGGLLDDLLKEAKEDNKDNTDFIKGLELAAANVAVRSVQNSFLDFNFIESVGSPVTSWTPFAAEWLGRQYSNIIKVATGDEDIWDGILNIASVNKQIRPALDAIKPEMFRTKREGGTWESATTIRNRERRENKD